jgi:hypothetical protein
VGAWRRGRGLQDQATWRTRNISVPSPIANASEAQHHQGFLQRIYNDVALSAPALAVVMAVLAARAEAVPLTTEERVAPAARACAP